jgi:hypothetical protein
MRYICIKCGVIWIIGEPGAELSGGLCDRCITQYVREKQKRQGFDDCFRRATEICSKTECSYWEHCMPAYTNYAEGGKKG